MDVAEKLEAIAAEIEAHPERWTQGAFVRRADGSDAVGARDPMAVQWCALGFCRREGIPVAPLFPALPGRHCIAWFNDAPGRTPAEVADLFRRAAALAKEPSHHD